MNRLLGMALTVAMSTCLAVQAEETLESVKEKVCERWENVKSVTADVKMVQQQAQQGMNMKRTLNADMYLRRQDDTVLLRQEGTQQAVMTMGERTQNMDGKIMILNNGEFIWVQSEMMGQTRVVKRKAEGPQQFQSACDMFENLSEENQLSFAGEEKVEGTNTWIIVAKPKTPGPNKASQIKLFIRQQDGILSRLVAFSTDGKPAMTMSYSNIKTNEKIDPEKFEYTPPPGVEVQDLTQMSTPTTQPASPDKP